MVARNRPNVLMEQHRVKKKDITKHRNTQPSFLVDDVLSTFNAESNLHPNPNNPSRHGPNLFSLKKLLPVLMEMDMDIAMAQYGKILDKLCRAFLNGENDLGLVAPQRRTRERQALFILRTLFHHSLLVYGTYPSEGKEFREKLKAELHKQMQMEMFPTEFEHFYGQITRRENAG